MNFHFSLKQLQIFMACVKFSNFTKAAQFLHTTQPAISIQMKKLEYQIGAKLFSLRSDKRIQLTPSGRTIYQKLQKTYYNLESFSQFIDEFQHSLQGNLAIGIPSSCLDYLLSILKKFQLDHPNVIIDLQVLSREALINAIKNHELDLAIMSAVPNQALSIEVIDTYSLYLIASELHPLFHKKNITLADLTDETIILGETGSEPRKYLETHFVNPTSNLFYVNSSDGVYKAVENNLGISIVGIFNNGIEKLSKVKPINIKPFPVRKPLNLVCSSIEELSPIANKLRQSYLLTTRIK
ncbi:LysR family transcriptional regulator [Francisella sp. SYW-9]|uniref:LysR family transcriptional regulator n=1 Tax=Francisella sp. SYW-9 TaxID=2610888 RepID=UPI00123D5CC5|nr:LysR family transcriptional regulator [Francisella sp. SYW-9]